MLESQPLLIATHNQAKLKRYRSLLARFAWLQTLAPRALGLQLCVPQTGTTAAENAYLKARTFAGAAGLPALGIDEALYIPALPPEAQPGVLVRRAGGKTLDDEELAEAALREAPLAAAVAVVIQHWTGAPPAGDACWQAD